MAPITGILLAAGNSTRFGGDKLARALDDGDTLAERACRQLLAGTGDVVAVVRPGADGLAARLRRIGARVETCADAERGMGTSLACGVRACPDADGWLIALADMPWVRPDTIRAVADALRSGALLAAPTWLDRRGHPVGFSAALGGELAALDGDQGAKVVLQAHEDRLHLLDCQDPGVLLDIDTPADLAHRKHNR